ncbi:SH3 domain-containing protein [Roseovarius nanhaiticus]|uniref:SH3 domain-containing protein n=1 Tax=Roseovarius nanhaiticus TaxID=573024 RepID=A0A1N7FWV4_9RHOB|nr:SH3 domain-containing protein [Roseovarius nanhaiticus]SEK43238.1 SH3 domain-containing protein [Roseovarius nanhaiticus]SIS04828.1 SH3 domain-containing protein [Roseovarius nanhaiticus]
MWRFIMVSFAFLGLAFYEVSGGADYAPAPNSLQVAMADKPLFAPALDLSELTRVAAAEPEQAPKASTEVVAKAERAKPATEMRGTKRAAPVTFAGLSGVSEDELGGFGITLASASQPLNGGNAGEIRGLEGIGSFDAETLVADVRNTPIDRAVISTQSAAPQQTATDIRSIAGDRANMRSGPGTDFAKVDQLTRGTDVEILGRRGAWVELRDLDTGQTGWMADWLVTAAN